MRFMVDKFFFPPPFYDGRKRFKQMLMLLHNACDRVISVHHLIFGKETVMRQEPESVCGN